LSPLFSIFGGYFHGLFESGAGLVDEGEVGTP